MEEVLLNVMYELPSREDVTKCLVDRDVVLTGVNPTLVPRETPSSRRRRRARAPRTLGMTSRRLAGAALLLLLAACSGDPGKLVGHRWVLDPTSIARLQVEVPAGTIVDLRFEEADLSGTSGCNHYGASYEAGNGSIDLGQISSR